VNVGWIGLGLLTAVASAIAFYAASPHCHWRLSHQRLRISDVAGALLAIASLVAWIHSFGAAVGVSTMLAAWMLAMIALPWFALFTKGKIAGSTRGR
jgi:hypothetical protein